MPGKNRKLENDPLVRMIILNDRADQIGKDLKEVRKRLIRVGKLMAKHEAKYGKSEVKSQK